MQGVLSTRDAIARAFAVGLDLVEISPNAEPPVAKILDYGKFKYEQQKKRNEARKKQKVVEIKEVKVRPNIDENDYQVKLRAMKSFIGEGDKVKGYITLPRPRNGASGAGRQSAGADQGRYGYRNQGRTNAQNGKPANGDGADAALDENRTTGEAANRRLPFLPHGYAAIDAEHLAIDPVAVIGHQHRNH